MQVDVLGELVPAVVSADVLYDPEGRKLRLQQPAFKQVAAVDTRGRANARNQVETWLQLAVLMILAIDQGTTGTTCLLVDEELTVRGRGYAELPQHFPRAGLGRARPGGDLAERARGRRAARAGRREPTRRSGSRTSGRRRVLWDRRPATGRTARSSGRTAAPPSAAQASPAELDPRAHRPRPDPYFSATKLEWLLRAHDAGRRAGVRHDRLVARLEADRRARARDRRDQRIADAALLARDARLGRRAARRSSASPRAAAGDRARRGARFGEGELLGRDAADPGHRRRPAGRALRQACFAAGEAKATYGTGAFVLVEHRASSGTHGVLRTAAARLEHEAPRRALEGAVFVDGRGDPVAAGRAGADRGRGRERGARSVARRQRRRLLRAGVRRARVAALARRRARDDHGLTRGTTPRAARARGARGDRVPDGGRAGRDAAARPAARRRRNDAATAG